MYNDRTQTCALQKNYILQYLSFNIIIQHSVAAVFHYNSFTFKITQIGQRFH